MQTPSQPSSSAVPRITPGSSAKPRKIKASSLLSVIVLLPIVALFFFCGVYVGSLFISGGQPVAAGAMSAHTPRLHEEQMSLGLPGTKNVLRKWAPNLNPRSGAPAAASNLRGPPVDEPKEPPPAPPAAQLPVSSAPQHTERQRPVTGSDSPLLQQSLHAQPGAYLEGPSDLDSDDVLVGAWVYLDAVGPADTDMRWLHILTHAPSSDLPHPTLPAG